MTGRNREGPIRDKLSSLYVRSLIQTLEFLGKQELIVMRGNRPRSSITSEGSNILTKYNLIIIKNLLNYEETLSEEE